MTKRRAGPSGESGRAPLPEAELEVLSCLWRMSQGTAREVRQALAPYRPMGHGSAVTLLNRLEAKGLVSRAKAPVGKAFIYRPTRQPGPTYRRLVSRMLERVFGGNGVALVATLFEAQPPTANQIDELEALLNRLRRDAGATPERPPMNAAPVLLNHAADAWWPVVLHASWQAGLVALLALAAVALHRRWPAPLRHGLLLLAVAKFAVPPLLAAPTGLFTWSGPVVLDPRAPAASGPAASPHAPALDPGWAASPLPPARRARAGNSPGPRTDDAPPRSVPPAYAGGLTPAAAAPATEPAAIQAQALPAPPLTWRAWLMLAHAAMAFAVAVATAWELVRLRRLLRQARPVEAGPLHDALLDTARRLRVRRRIRLLITDAPVSPMAVGVLRPAIVLPAPIAAHSRPGELAMILAHELAHHRRGDLMANWCQLILRILWWFHPCFWLLDRQVRRTREDCCDDLLLSRGVADRRGYCEALLSAARELTRPVPIGATLGMAERLHPLARRLGRIMDASLPRSASLSLVGVTALLIAALLVLPGLRTQASPAAGAPTHPPAMAPTRAPAASAIIAPAIMPATQPSSLAVSVVDATTGQAVAGAAVHASIKPADHDRERADYVTDARGQCRVSLPAGPCEWVYVSATSSGRAKLVFEFNPDDGLPLPPDIRFALEKRATIGGVVHDEQGRPIAGVRVLIRGYRAHLPGTFMHTEIPQGASALTDSDGRWRYDEVPASLVGAGSDMRVFLRFQHPDFVSDPPTGGSLYALPGDAGPALLKLAQATVMKKGTELSGHVLDDAGRPLVGARVGHWLVRGWIGSPDWVTTDQEGRFVFGHVDAPSGGLLAKAKGRAPQYRLLATQDAGKAIEFRLRPGYIVRGQVTDPAGKPVSGVRLRPGHWPELGDIDFDWEGVTDEAGRFEWTEAPADELWLWIEKEGYVQEHKATVRPADGKPLAITLPRVPWVSGRVVDAASGKAITGFRIAYRFRSAPPPGQPDADWAWMWRDFLTPQPFTAPEGGFRFAARDGWTDGQEIVLRAMAPGYLPAVSRGIQLDRADDPVEIRLQRGGVAPAGRVLLPDGAAARGATVMLATPQHNGAMIYNGRADPNTMAPIFALPQATGTDGRFTFLPEDRRSTVVALHGQGYAVATQAELEARDPAGASAIILEPWARLEGHWFRHGAPAAQREVTLTITNELSFNPYESRVAFSSAATTDSQGRFLLDHVPSTAGRVASWQWATEMGSQSRAFLTPIAPGQTVQFSIGPACRDVAGRVELPVDLKWIDMERPYVSVELLEKSPQPALDRATRGRLMSCATWGERGGAFRLESVPPGEYEMQIEVTGWIGNRTRPYALGSGAIRVEAAAGDAPLDLGAVKVWRVATPAMGQPAPALEVIGAEGRPLRLADYRGRYVLVCFWGTQDPAMVPWLEDLRDRTAPYANDARLAVLGINMSAAARIWGQPDPGAKARPRWNEGVVRFGAVRPLAEFGAAGIDRPAVLLVDPQGKVVATGLEGKTLTETLDRALKGHG